MYVYVCICLAGYDLSSAGKQVFCDWRVTFSAQKLASCLLVFKIFAFMFMSVYEHD